ncbi:hypothetical protein SORBI_3002G015600 [Sorghum bicolor]|uniref:F-box domain-containing protein n=1 Tax=Sorghum bicolor TaxID=4558 RepID=A0A1B6Q8Q5_SORBI|nr:hypothetical protein SORBI_3002G015600 [Sorghum bicolor]
MGMVTRAKRRRQEEEERERLADRISSLPDDVLVDIVSLLPTKDGARTQVLSSMWRHLWCSAPLNLDFHDDHVGIVASDISHILSTHPGPVRRFVMPRPCHGKQYPTSTVRDGWLRSPALDNLQELQFSGDGDSLLLPSVHRFSPTLCIARFSDCSILAAGGNDAGPLHWPLLKQLTLFSVSISESSLHALLAGCPVLESLLLLYNRGLSRLQIVSRSLRSIGVHSGHNGQQLVIEDAPCLERLLYFGGTVNISVISAPRLAIFGKLFDGFPMLQFGAMVFKITRVSRKDWCTYRKLTSTLDIGLRKIVLRNYRANKSHLNLARFFVSIAKVLELMRFEIEGVNFSNKWIGKQQRLLQIKKGASRVAQFDFVFPGTLIRSHGDRRDEQVHDLSANPFHRFHY